MQMPGIAHLPCKKLSDVYSRDLELEPSCAGRQTLKVVTFGRPAGKGAEAYDRPVQPARFYQLLLHLMIMEYRCQQGTEHNAFPKEIQVGPALLSRQRRLHNQPSNPGRLHGMDHGQRTLDRIRLLRDAPPFSATTATSTSSSAVRTYVDRIASMEG